jgi:hypothetical protein
MKMRRVIRGAVTAVASIMVDPRLVRMHRKGKRLSATHKRRLWQDWRRIKAYSFAARRVASLRQVPAA